MTYPSSLDELTDGVPSDGAAPTTALDNATYPHDDHHRALAVAVEAVEAELGTDPSGAAATVAARIAATETVANAAASKASNLSDLASASSARTNLGLGGAAVLSVGTTAGTVAAGDDSRLTDARTPTAHASSHAGAGSDPITSLGPVTVLTAAAGTVPLATKGAAAQTANLQQWQDSTGSAMTKITSTGDLVIRAGYSIQSTAAAVYIYFNESSAALYHSNYGATIRNGVTTQQVLVVKSVASQTAKMQEWQNSAGAVLASVDAAGLHKWASGNEQTTVGAAGAASAVPASPTKYLKVVGSDGTTYVVPAFLAA